MSSVRADGKIMVMLRPVAAGELWVEGDTHMWIHARYLLRPGKIAEAVCTIGIPANANAIPADLPVSKLKKAVDAVNEHSFRQSEWRF